MILPTRFALFACMWVWVVTSVGSLPGAEDHSVARPGSPAIRMDYGSMLTYTVGFPEGTNETNANLALKGICIQLGEANQTAVCFDTDLLRYYAGWTGGFLDLSKTHLTSSKGSWHALIQGDVKFSTSVGPGWSKTGNFSDPRPIAAGPLARASGLFKGIYRHGRRVILNYLVDGTEIFEMPDSLTTNGLTFFSRSFHVGKTDAPMTLRLCDVDATGPGGRVVTSALGDLTGVLGKTSTWVKITGGKAKVVVTEGGSIQVRLPALSMPTDFQVFLWSGPANVATSDAGQFLRDRPVVNPKELCRGGPARWPEEIVTTSRMGTGNASYVADSVDLPERNPWNSWMRLVAFDFFAEGRAAVSTWNGDVWIVSGLTGKLERVTWRRYAAGLFEPLGLKIVDDQVFVLCRDQLMRLRDLNADGEADFYECFSNETWLSPSYHAFAFDLQTDRAGNFYYTRCGQRVDPALPLNGGMVKVSKDGSHAELIASGLRAANGMAIGPNDEIVCSDNQGNWIPSSRINWIRPGAFYGYLPHARQDPAPADYEKPICWLPMKIDNSSGGQVWVTSGRWGPFEGQLLHTSYGRGSLFLVMMEEVRGTRQGGVVQFPLKFDSGIMRARFNPRDGQLWVCGLRGWQTSGGRDGALQRVRYTGIPVHMPSALHTTTQGVNITFTCAMDEASANDEQSYAAEVWNYEWTEKYGSPEFSVADPRQQRHDPVSIKSTKLSSDGKTVFLEIPDLKPAMQMKIQFRLKAADGTPVEYEIYNTINQLPGN